MRAEEIRDLNDEEIAARVSELQEERFRLRFRSATETLDEPLRQRAIRREVARLKTVMRERALKGSAPVAGAKAGSVAGGKAGRATGARGGRKS